MKKVVVAAALTLAVVAIAFATITFDPTTGIGFVGKGDVQAALGWNNKDLQTAATSDGIRFTYNINASYTGTCQWLPGNPDNKKAEERLKTNYISQTIDVKDAIGYTSRSQNQISGFFLNGFGAVNGAGIPKLGDSCDAEGHNNQGTLTAVEVLSYDAGLYVNNVRIY